MSQRMMVIIAGSLVVAAFLLRILPAVFEVKRTGNPNQDRPTANRFGSRQTAEEGLGPVNRIRLLADHFKELWLASDIRRSFSTAFVLWQTRLQTQSGKSSFKWPYLSETQLREDWQKGIPA